MDKHTDNAQGLFDRPLYVFLQPGDIILPTDESWHSAQRGAAPAWGAVGNCAFTGYGWHGNLLPMRRLVTIAPQQGRADSEPANSSCNVCGGSGWVEDQNWSPEYPTISAPARTERNGLITCGRCLGDGKAEAPTVPAIDATQAKVTAIPLDDEVKWILGRPNYACIGLADSLRMGGQDIERNAECERAAVLHWMLNLYLTVGSTWRDLAEARLREISALRIAALRAVQQKGGGQ